MRIINTIDEMRQALAERDPGQKLGFVPTMGYLHKGHLSLVESCTVKCGLSVVSIYVNPSQFGPQEDLGSYPRDLERDLDLLAQQQVDYVFFPDDAQMYPEGYLTWVEVAKISDVLCGASRPGHFRGVATIVLKLVNIIRPDLMFMGLKDFQQIVVLETMLRDLNLSTQIERCPIVREVDGLALSSRNIYLNRDERHSATCLVQALRNARRMASTGIKESAAIIKAAEEIVNSAGGRIDYVRIVDSATLSEQQEVNENSRMLLAVFIGKTRLIDNSALIT
ncbi:MAG: pantoate--beta-alanine ligase [Candidatus Syntrophosphaera sp.]|nr:pantoate--beta-alanine ligase [Candidatus Syntrophosphaera sp.]